MKRILPGLVAVSLGAQNLPAPPAPLLQAIPTNTRRFLAVHSPTLANLKFQAMQQRLRSRTSALTEMGPEFHGGPFPTAVSGAARVTLDKGSVLMLATDAAALAERLQALPQEGGWMIHHKGRRYLLGARLGWTVVADEGRRGAWLDALKPGPAPLLAPLDETLASGDLVGWIPQAALVAEFLESLSPFPLPEALRTLLAAALPDTRDAAFSLGLDASGNAQLMVRGRAKPEAEAGFARVGRAEAWGLSHLPGRPWVRATGGFLPTRWIAAFAEPRAWRPPELSPALARSLDAAQRQVIGFGHMAPAREEPEALRLDVGDRDDFREALARVAIEPSPATEKGGGIDKAASAGFERGAMEGRDAFTLSLPDPSQGGAVQTFVFAQAGDRAWGLGLETQVREEDVPPATILSDDEALKAAAANLPPGAAFYAFENPRAAWLEEAARLGEQREGLDPDLRDRFPDESNPPEAPPLALALVFSGDAWSLTCTIPAETQMALALRGGARQKARAEARMKVLEEQRGRLARGKQ